eukprot:scaffold77122_cov19-Tisochrysis_lutea.AAC.1
MKTTWQCHCADTLCVAALDAVEMLMMRRPNASSQLLAHVEALVGDLLQHAGEEAGAPKEDQTMDRSKGNRTMEQFCPETSSKLHTHVEALMEGQLQQVYTMHKPGNSSQHVGTMRWPKTSSQLHVHVDCGGSGGKPAAA